ncbi:thermonuclease family protein [Jannaschia sp. W003]|uniref:thermonuclease family protein n=1 Tax=Jannaschia sp. W003 TaxID=2867012 RepID=UPI0021A6718B|nr:thermonuclease family protein [Jannaschia sp. W003]UWQ20665.1 thermonuclease family protein [Jannaschia sp. W003]
MLRLCSLFVALAAALPAGAQTLSGTVRVVDADTFDIGAPETIRLVGIDAPEAAQGCRDGARELPCGRMATEWARAMFEGRTAVCRVEDVDRYDRYLAVCEVGGRDANAALVREGVALRYRDDPRYAEEEKEAILLGRGVWAYDMLNPAAWRDAQRAERAEANAPDAGDCPIKGNISGNGKLYHVPGTGSYGPTRIDETKGERWFCTEAEAEKAGWTRAGGR